MSGFRRRIGVWRMSAALSGFWTEGPFDGSERPREPEVAQARNRERECMSVEREIDILLVEDNEQDAALVLYTLRKRHLADRVHRVKDGVEALDYLLRAGGEAGQVLSRPPKLILLDLRLPGMDGPEVLWRLKADERTRMIPVVVLAGSPAEEGWAQGLQLGANSCIVKPVAWEEFSRAIARVAAYWLSLNQPPESGPKARFEESGCPAMRGASESWRRPAPRETGAAGPGERAGRITGLLRRTNWR